VRNVHTRFDENGELVDEDMREELHAVVDALARGVWERELILAA
jgi:hypothetical protein